MTVAIKSIRELSRSLTAILTVAALALVSCRNEEPDGMKVTLYPVVMSNVETVIETRALVGDYSELNTVGSTIKANAVAFSAGDARAAEDYDANGTFTKAETDWTSNVEVTDDFYYNVYTYSPASFPAATVAFDYASGTPKLTFTDLAAITGSDPLMGIAAAGGTLAGTAPELTKGSYATGKISINNAENDNARTRVWLAMDHLYARATVLFKVDADYNSIRTVKVKSATVSIEHGTLAGTSTYTYAKGSDDAVISWNSATSYTGDAVSVEIVGDNTPAASFDSEENQVITLDEDAKEVGWFCMLPKIKPVLTLTVTYDVYDKAGTLVRENQVVTNNRLLRKLVWPDGVSIVGNNYLITVKLNPTYLYQLSDGDAALEIVIED